ncbi:hypothetical protein J40TS1_13530 [Paenibacillus montaniterrae]|uniref:DUF456 domain-containing protein n=1 Tax=Paenibacillus montaniterrae TaxID=429341 RepID=A0A920CW92_9BACL|nr:DUF456 domain-containing protein [Paenibacillus montaniterrae]GIP15711.1 hypothetical protein J40TS1_13530 [Paenibacillus montaniterrae]
MDILGIAIVVILFVVGMLGAIYPVLPGVFAIYAAFFVYGWFFSFDKYNVWFWIIQTFILVVLIIADYVVGAWGVKKYGGSKASVVGSTIGIIAGPFVIPAFGLVLGPFLGAVIGELLAGSKLKQSLLVGWGSLIGLLSSVFVKIVLQLVMIILFIVWVW